jgi:hypothetical protein
MGGVGAGTFFPAIWPVASGEDHHRDDESARINLFPVLPVFCFHIGLMCIGVPQLLIPANFTYGSLFPFSGS